MTITFLTIHYSKRIVIGKPYKFCGFHSKVPNLEYFCCEIYSQSEEGPEIEFHNIDFTIWSSQTKNSIFFLIGRNFQNKSRQKDGTFLQNSYLFITQLLAIASIISNNVGSTFNVGAVVFYNVVVIMGFWYTLILLIFYVCHVIEKFYGLPWLRAELVCTGLMVILYIIASIIVVVTPYVAQVNYSQISRCF
jgi:hypothetical protein